MGDFTFNVAKGSISEIVRTQLAKANGTSIIGVMLLRATGAGGALEADATLKDYDTVAALLSPTTNDECIFTGYVRKILKVGDSPGVVRTVNDLSDVVDIDLPDIVWTPAGGAQNDVVAKVVTYALYGAGTNGDDTQNIPLTAHDYSMTTNGSSLIVAFSSGTYVGG